MKRLLIASLFLLTLVSSTGATYRRFIEPEPVCPPACGDTSGNDGNGTGTGTGR